MNKIKLVIVLSRNKEFSLRNCNLKQLKSPSRYLNIAIRKRRDEFRASQHEFLDEYQATSTLIVHSIPPAPRLQKKITAMSNVHSHIISGASFIAPSACGAIAYYLSLFTHMGGWTSTRSSPLPYFKIILIIILYFLKK